MTGKSRKPVILVLGANGKLGRLLNAVWATSEPDGWDIRFVSRVACSGRIQWSPGQDIGLLGQADAIVALWGVVSGPDLGANTVLAGVARDIGRAAGARVVMHMSSAAVYGRLKGNFREDTPPKPANPYGAAKLDMEKRVLTFQDKGGPAHKILRIGNVVGADSLFSSLNKPDLITLDKFPDGYGPARSYLCVQTFAELLVAIAERPDAAPDVLNAAECAPVEMADIVQAAGRKVLWRKAPDGALQRAVLDTDRLASLITLDPARATAGGIVADWQKWQGALA